MSKESFETVISALGKPNFFTERIAIYKGDCLEKMKSIPSSLIDLIITSPPYNIGKEYEELVSISNYVAWCEKWLNEIHRIASPSASFWLNLGYFEVPNKGLAVPISYLLWDKSPFYFLQEVVWNYSAGVACKTRFSPRNEKLLWYVKDLKNYVFNLDEIRDPNVKYPNQKKNGKLKCNPLGKNPTDVWQIAKVTSGKNRASKERTPHPAQFPIEMVDRIIKSCSNVDDLVIDPFMGSGSTAESALKNDRYVIGFELEEKYIGYISERIKTYTQEEKIKKMQPELELLV